MNDSKHLPRLGASGALTLLLALAAAAPASAGTFRLQAKLSPTPSAQQGSDFLLEARLAPARAEPAVLLGSQHALTAKLAAVPMVCYDDTIFRDGYDWN